MQAYVDAGLTTFDMADIYGPAEEIFGQFNSQVPQFIGSVCKMKVCLTGWKHSWYCKSLEFFNIPLVFLTEAGDKAKKRK